jgi:Holliday junction DNA helicase RuvA
LEGIKGIGKKSAERLIVELRDKLARQPLEAGFGSEQPGAMDAEGDAVQALVALGIARVAAENAVKKTIKAGGETIGLEELIKLALKNI